MALKREQRVVAGHAPAIVGDADQASAAGLNLDADAGGAGIERVLQQLLDDGGGAVDDLAGGDLVGDLVGENVNAAHCPAFRICGCGVWRSGSVPDAKAKWPRDCAAWGEELETAAEILSVRLRASDTAGRRRWT